MGSRAQPNNRARYSRTFTNTGGGDVFSRLGGEGGGGGVIYGGGGAEQMDMGEMHIRYWSHATATVTYPPSAVGGVVYVSVVWLLYSME